MQTGIPNRHELRQRRRSIPPDIHTHAASALAAQILSLPGLATHRYIAGYWAVDGEISLHILQQHLPAECIWCLPVLDEASKLLKFAPWQAGDALVNNRYGIPEPDHTHNTLLDARQMDLIVLPLTGFDSQCHRLGMGGGWYDRTLAFRQQTDICKPVLLGAGFDLQEIACISPSPWDIACDYIATETRLISRLAP
ncbi:5-formyltetrahydrofolate cyclo-ligase [Lysobacteraceae bacterium NML95-0200]|nr:5-formyltetrahydrofolate cyclo-ligase [Xanthomonadaceae bacterium NML95-0200]